MLRFPVLLIAACAPDYGLNPGPVDVDPGDVTDCDFTQVLDDAGTPTDFWEYDCNPVFTTTGENWADTIDSTAFAVTEVVGHPFYQLWYTGVPAGTDYGDYALGYAVSPQGTHWTPAPANPLIEEPEGSAWDASGMDAMQVVWDPGADRYVMVYQGYNIQRDLWGLGAATSTDGQAWSLLPTNPVVDLTARGPDGIAGYCWPLGLTLGDVVGYTGYIAGYPTPDGPCQVYTIASAGVDDWQPQSKLVLPAGGPGDWDDEGMISLAIAELDGTQMMFYVGFGAWDDHGNYVSSRNQYVGWAKKRGGTWEKQGDPLPLSRAPDGLVGAVAARTVGSHVALWITDDYDGVSAVGYFLYDPNRGAVE